jgi:MFS family permease
MVGTVVATVLLVRLGGIRRQGLAVLVGLGLGALIISLLYFRPSYIVFMLAIFLWGLLGGVVMTMNRTILQEAAPSSHRARILSIFSLANLGGLPLGALLMGYSAEFWGNQGAVAMAAGGILVSVIVVGTYTDFWRLGPWSGPDNAKII